MSAVNEFIDKWTKAEMGIATLTELKEFDISDLFHEIRTDSMQTLLRQLKAYCKDGNLNENYLDAVIDKEWQS